MTQNYVMLFSLVKSLRDILNCKSSNMVKYISFLFYKIGWHPCNAPELRTWYTWVKSLLDFTLFRLNHNKIFSYFFYDCTVHFEIYVLHTTTNALFINLVNSFKFTLKYTVISLLHVSVFNDHSALHTTHMPLYDMLPHHLIYIMM